MNVQDIASINANYFNYMVASEESEGSNGWYYTTWVNDLYKSPTIDSVTLGKSIVDSYASSSEYNNYTLSVLDLSKMDAYIKAFDTLTDEIAEIVGSSQDMFDILGDEICYSALQFGIDEDYNVTFFDLFDVQSFLTHLVKSEGFESCKIAPVETALKNLVVYNKYGSYYTDEKPCGLGMIMVVVGISSPEEYNKNSTHFTKWLELMQKFGNWYSEE